jgi:twitching motility protein PilU
MIKLRNNEQQGAGFLQGVTIDGLDDKGNIT